MKLQFWLEPGGGVCSLRRWAGIGVCRPNSHCVGMFGDDYGPEADCKLEVKDSIGIQSPITSVTARPQDSLHPKSVVPCSEKSGLVCFASVSVVCWPPNKLHRIRIRKTNLNLLVSDGLILHGAESSPSSLTSVGSLHPMQRTSLSLRADNRW